MESLVRVNSRRCQREPVYGRDFHQAFTIAKRCVCGGGGVGGWVCTCVGVGLYRCKVSAHCSFLLFRATVDERRKTQSSWLWCGRDACHQAVVGAVWDQFTHSLLGAVKSVQQRALECEDLLSRSVSLQAHAL